VEEKVMLPQKSHSESADKKTLTSDPIEGTDPDVLSGVSVVLTAEQ
jgi:hypothetical protein